LVDLGVDSFAGNNSSGDVFYFQRRKWFFAMPCRRRGPMTFDELWRANLDQERACGDSVEKAEAIGLRAVPGENANELLLTAEDCVFLSALGIKA
jgi:hypothetical protein